MMSTDAEVVVVGGGFAGSAVATALARQGVETLVLEKTTVHQDRVRGEFMAPWGVAEARTLGILDDLLAGGANFTTVHIPFNEGVDPEVARARAFNLGQFAEGVPGPVCMQHVAMANVLNRVAVEAGANLVRGVEGVQVRSGENPSLDSFWMG